MSASIEHERASTGPPDEVHIAVVAGTTGELQLDSELELLKPALLYADHVTLYSPVALLLGSTVTVASDPEMLLQVLREVGSSLDPTLTHTLAAYDELVARRHKTRKELQTLIGVKRMLVEAASDLLAKADEIVEQAGGSQLAPALEAGLVSIDQLLRDDTGGDGEIFEAFLDRLRDLLRDGHAYPLLDDQVGGLVRAAIAERAWELGATPRRRSKEVSAAARFMDRLPAFPAATVPEILEIREELRSPLVRFRSALVEVERLISAAAHEPDFAAEVNDIFRERVAPALLEIGEKVEHNRSLRHLMAAAVKDGETILSAAVAVAVTANADLPHLIAAALDLAVPTTVALAKAAWSQSVETGEIERLQMFFLYQTNAMLQTSAHQPDRTRG